MNYITKIRKADYIASHYGVVSQLFQTMEEMSELNREIVNFLTDKNYNIEEEIADLWVMLLQLQLMFNADNIDRIISEKLDRQIARIKVEIEEKEKAEKEEEINIPEMTEDEMEHLDKIFAEAAGETNEESEKAQF